MIFLFYLNVPDELSLKDTLQTNLIAFDVRKQSIERPVKHQENYYSGKKKQYTIKVFIFLCLFIGLIKAMRFLVETVHDFQIYKEKVFEISEKIKILGDSGFQGIKKRA